MTVALKKNDIIELFPLGFDMLVENIVTRLINNTEKWFNYLTI